MKTYPSIGLGVPEILLPRPDLDLQAWAVIACDQYTSQPEYWDRVDARVGDAPSTLRLVFPEVFLSAPDPDGRIARIRAAMDDYVKRGVLEPHDGMIYLERTIGDRVRRGLVTALDLDAYDFRRGSGSLIRATEGTIVDRLPPRVKVRAGAPLESPHIMVLIDDPDDTVIGPLARSQASLRKLYDFELMLGGGHLTGYSAASAEAEVVGALEALADTAAFERRYALAAGTPVLLFAMGDGNHSLATAKTIWETVKVEGAAADDPRRFALVELVNLHDDALDFEPIHRVLFDVPDGEGLIAALRAHFGARLSWSPVDSCDAMTTAVAGSTTRAQRFGVVSPEGYAVAEVADAGSNLPVGTLQAFLDPHVAAGGAREVDYVHGTDVVDRLGRSPGNLAFFLPPMDKHDLFKTVIVDGALPRKTFSMGEADEKRFYMECRRIG